MNEKWQVYKFGGSSLGTTGRLSRVLDLISSGARPLAVVVSALGETTDWLLLAARSAADGESTQTRGQLNRMHELVSTVARPVLSSHGLRAFEVDVDKILQPVERMLSGIELTRECSPRSLATVIHVGERVSAALVSRALREREVTSKAIDARDFVVTDSNFSAAAVELAPTEEKFKQLLPSFAESVPIVTGFIGRTKNGHTTTLGRNGSDYTATLLALLLHAEAVTVWTDVLGVMTADPKLVPEAKPVDRLSYDEALELAYFGMRMFHPHTVIPLRSCGAVLVIRSTMQPDAPGTRIDATGNLDKGRPTCVTSLENLSLISVQSRCTGPGRPIASRILAPLYGAAIPVLMTTESTLGQTFSFVVPQAEEERMRTVLQKALAPEFLHGDLTLGPVFSPVTLVAESMGCRSNASGRMLNSIGSVGIPVRAMAQGALARSVSCVVDAVDTALAVNAAHSAFSIAHTELNILLLGKGIVGSSLLRQLAAQSAKLCGNYDVQVRLAGFGGSKSVLFSAKGIPTDQSVSLLEGTSVDCSALRSVVEVLPELARLPNPVLVDCTGVGGMEELYDAAFTHGINVVSANKQPLVLPLEKYDALITAARRHYCIYHYETTVGAALPVIETLKNLLRTGDHVWKIEGAFSSTFGYLCEQVTNGVPLSQAVRRAKELGYTEPNPRDDFSGIDVAQKALILARELGLRLDLSDVALEVFEPSVFLAENDTEKFLDSLTSADDDFAKRVAALRGEKKVLRYLAQIEADVDGPKIRVAPVGVDIGVLASTLRGAENFVEFYSNRYKEYPLVVRGSGAGGDVTASGVFADILRLAQNIRGYCM